MAIAIRIRSWCNKGDSLITMGLFFIFGVAARACVVIRDAIASVVVVIIIAALCLVIIVV